MNANPSPAWTPPTTLPPPVDPDPRHTAIVVKAPQEMTAAEWAAICAAAHAHLHTVTPSHDDTRNLLLAGNNDSYVKVAFPERPSQQETIEMLDFLGYRWEVLPGFGDAPPPSLPQLVYRPCQTSIITQYFGANPGSYPGMPGHDGLDYAVAQAHPFYAAAAGTVVHASDRRWTNSSLSAYGWHVVIDHGDYCTVYGHATPNLPVSAGDQVTAGAVVGYSGNTGNSSGYHLHFGLLDKTGTIDPNNGFPNWLYGRAVDPLPFVQGKPAPPTNNTIDLLPYLRGDGRLYEVRNADGGQERLQTQVDGVHFYQTKHAEWEELYVADSFICRDRDTSPGGNRWYRLIEGAVPGSRWIPRYWRPGQEYTRARYVQAYRKEPGCPVIPENSGPVVDTMRFIAHHQSYLFRTGLILPDVVELLWINGGERYFYARGFGLVGWERQHQDPHTPAWSAISEIHEPNARPDNVREVLPC
jgi:murein DD-endopeptidase MepM/ murein hydrolase activator NlpD